jgi:pre-mRNA-processing factor 8
MTPLTIYHVGCGFPQHSSNNRFELPAQLPRNNFLLKDLEPLGWIKMQAPPTDVTTQAKSMVADYPE